MKLYSNENNETLTTEKLRQFKGLENLSEDDAKETVFALQTYASLLFDLVAEQQKTEMKILNEPNSNQLKNAA